MVSGRCKRVFKGIKRVEQKEYDGVLGYQRVQEVFKKETAADIRGNGSIGGV